MRLEKLNLKNFRCFEDLTIEFDSNLTVLIGGNGSGKTSILEAAAIAIGGLTAAMNKLPVPVKNLPDYEIQNPNDVRAVSLQLGKSFNVQPQYPVEVSVSGSVTGEKISWKRELYSANAENRLEGPELMRIAGDYLERMKWGDASLHLPIIAYYSTERLWKNSPFSEDWEVSNRCNGYVDSLNGAANNRLMMQWFRKEFMKSFVPDTDSSVLNTVLDAMSATFRLMTKSEIVSFSIRMDTQEMLVTFTDPETEKKETLAMNQLSDGYRSMLSLVADIAYRMAVLNPQLEDNVLQETEGVVIIDEIDLHLHPAWQQIVLNNLRKVFPKVQFIVSTHAPAVIASVESEHIVILNKDKWEVPGCQVFGKDANSLMKLCMGVSERDPDVNKLFTEFYEELKNKRLDSAEEKLAEVRKQVDSADTELAECGVSLALERFREGR